MVWIKPSSGDGLGVQTIATSGGGFTLRYDQTNSTIYTQVSIIYTLIPVNTERLYNIYTMLDQRRRRWADVV